MYCQDFTGKELYKLTTQQERRDLGLNEDQFVDKIDKLISGPMSSRSYSFNLCCVRGDLVVNGHGNSTPSKNFEKLCQELVLRKIYRNIKRIHRFQPADRNAIIKQIKVLLSSDSDFWVLRLDVKSFFGSLSREKVLSFIKSKHRLTPLTIHLIDNLCNHDAISGKTGIPKGQNISTALSELFMQSFDRALKQIPGVFYYARFVDDIIIFCTSDLKNEEVKNSVMSNVETHLKERGLKLNEKKTQYIKSEELDKVKLSYLGYSFSKENKILKVDIDGSKVKKIETRLVKSFISYAKKADFKLLLNRLQYLTGNCVIEYKATLFPLKVGIYYNYKYADDNCAGLKELDRFYKLLLHCKKSGPVYKALSSLTSAQRDYLKKYSFSAGFVNRITHEFSPDEINNISSCWT